MKSEATDLVYYLKEENQFELKQKECIENDKSIEDITSKALTLAKELDVLHVNLKDKEFELQMVRNINKELNESIY